MTQLVQAIFENGVFRPLDPVHVAEHERVSLVIESIVGAANEIVIAQQREALRKLRADMDSLPAGASIDGLGGADGDEILYVH
jgi:predicted DNA-binding antitoxin AbrB/MazE fold protein